MVLYEYLGEEYPEVLGSILGALKSIVNVIGMTKMTPPIKDLLPRLTPILKNRHEKARTHAHCLLKVCGLLCTVASHSPLAGGIKAARHVCHLFWTCIIESCRGLFRTKTDLVFCLVQVQENCIDLVGRIADRGAEYVPAREWMRICFELLEMLKAHKKGIRRATVNTFGYIAKAIGPQVESHACMPVVKQPPDDSHMSLLAHQGWCRV